MAENLKSMLVEKLATFDTMAVATSDPSGTVDCAAVYFAFDQEGSLYFATASTSQKALNLARNPKVSACMDDRKQVGVQIRGVATRLDGADAAQAKRMLLERHKAIARWFENPAVVFFRLTPKESFVINFAWGSDWRVPIAH